MNEVDVSNFRCRLRFRISKNLNISETKHNFEVAGRQIVLHPRDISSTSIADSEWLVMDIKGFASEQEAKEFGDQLKASVDLASVFCRIGVDTGLNSTSFYIHPDLRKALEEHHQSIIRDDVHGIDVFKDDSKIRFMNSQASATVRTSPEPFLQHVNEFFNIINNSSSRVRDIVLLLNYALSRGDPVAQIIFSISAVEMLGQDVAWSENQSKLLGELTAYATNSTIGTAEERDEIAEAIKRSLHKLSLRQGVFRLLDRIGLSCLRREWDMLYGERSHLVHGLAPQPGVDYSNLAFRVMNLSGYILMKTIAVELNLSEEFSKKHLEIWGNFGGN